MRPVDEDGILCQAAIVVQVTYISAEEGVILSTVLLFGSLQVVSPSLAVRQSGETVADYAASTEPNGQAAAFNPP
jgi:hypothetical protein